MKPSQVHTAIQAVMRARHEGESKALASKHMTMRATHVSGGLEQLDVDLQARRPAPQALRPLCTFAYTALQNMDTLHI